ncbi:NUC091 domain-containing protein [Chytridium lagenaria]|nr:NUC091 domain-containing protein [Chytridium lagenaria]
MGKAKKERNRVIAAGAATGASSTSTSQSLTNVTRIKGTNFYRDAKKVRQVNLLKGGKPVRNAAGKIIKSAVLQNRLPSGTVARVQADRRWFENTRVIGQKELESFREAMGEKADDPYTVLLRQNKLPMSLLVDSTKVSRMHLLETDPFANTFGPKAQRKKPKLSFASAEDLASAVNEKQETYVATKDTGLLANKSDHGMLDEVRDPVFNKGQSKRIWSELYKVIDSSDVVIHVIDARDPLGTRCRNVESYIRKEAPHKHLIFVLNKCDLVPTWATAKWVQALSREYPTLAFHASINNSFGKGSLIQLYKQISVGFIGYPNTGKSSIINTLRNKLTCKVAPIPGETKGVVRVENIKAPDDHIPAILERVKPEYVQRTYFVDKWEDHIDFLTQVAKRTGKLLKGAEPDINTVSKMILNDWLRGKIPYYTNPPELEPTEEESKNVGVDQVFSKIPVSTKFLPADLKTDLKVGETAAGSGEEGAEEVEEEKVVSASWDEVFGAVNEEEGGEEEEEGVEAGAERVTRSKTASSSPASAKKRGREEVEVAADEADETAINSEVEEEDAVEEVEAVIEVKTPKKRAVAPLKKRGGKADASPVDKKAKAGAATPVGKKAKVAVTPVEKKAEPVVEATPVDGKRAKRSSVVEASPVEKKAKAAPAAASPAENKRARRSSAVEASPADKKASTVVAASPADSKRARRSSAVEASPVEKRAAPVVEASPVEKRKKTAAVVDASPVDKKRAKKAVDSLPVEKKGTPAKAVAVEVVAEDEPAVVKAKKGKKVIPKLPSFTVKPKQ